MTSAPTHAPIPKPRQRINLASDPKSLGAPDIPPRLPQGVSLYEEPVACRPPRIRASQNNSSSQSLDEKAGGEEGQEHDLDSPEYADIDAEQRESECLPVSSDDDEEDVGFTGYSIRGSGYAPSIRLYNHPLLKKSQSVSIDDSPAPDTSRTDLNRPVKKPKNRAPPPPPGVVPHAGSVPQVTPGEDLLRAGAMALMTTPLDAVSRRDDAQPLKSSGCGHKRSKSAQFLDVANDMCENQDRAAIQSSNADQQQLQFCRPRVEQGRLSPTPALLITTDGHGHRSPGVASPSTSVSNFPIQQPGSGSLDHLGSNSLLQQETSPFMDVTRLSGDCDGGSEARPPSATKAKTKNNGPSHPLLHGKTPLSPNNAPPPGLSSKFTKGTPSSGHTALLAKLSVSRQHIGDLNGHDKCFSVEIPLASAADRHNQSERSLLLEPTTQVQDQSPGSHLGVKPKRHAPPPPVGGAMRPSLNVFPEDAIGRSSPSFTPPPIYSEVVKASKLAGEVSVASKPRQQIRAYSMDDLCSYTEAEPDVPTFPTSPMQDDAYEEVLKTMDLFTIELKKAVGQDVGLVLVSGMIRSGRGFVVSGVFVQHVEPGSCVEQDGRIQAGDMITQIFSHNIRENLDEALHFLELPSASVRVKVGRPDITSSVFCQGGIEDPVYTNQLVGPSYEEMLVKLEQVRIRSDEHEREKEMALRELQTFREKALKDREALMKELNEARESEPIYTNQGALEPNYEEIMEELEQSRLKSDEHERDKEMAINELQSFRDEALVERGALVKELEEAKQLLKDHQEDSRIRTSELSVTLANISVGRTKTEGELECHKEKLEDLKQQLKQEKVKAEQDLQAIKSCLMETEDKLKKQEDKGSSSQNNEAITKELQGELSKYKEDNSKMSAELAAEKEKVAELEERLKSTNVDLRREQGVNDRLQGKINAQALQISQFSLEIESLHEELKKVKLLATQTEGINKESQVPLSKSLPSSTKTERRRIPSPAREPPYTEDPPYSPLSEEDLPLQENSDALSDRESNAGEEDAFDDPSPSPVVPCPYIDFVPLQMPEENEVDKSEAKTEMEEGMDSGENGGESTDATDGGENKGPLGEDSGYCMAEEEVGKAEVAAEENTLTETEKAKNDQDETNEEEEVDEEKEKEILLEYFDAIKPHQMLDNSAAVYKSKMGGNKKKLPSRDHIRKKDGQGDILHNMPSASLSDLATPLEEPTSLDNDDEVADSLTENHSKSAVVSPQAKPRPKAAPRKKPVIPPPSGSFDQGKKQPLAAPRLRTNQDSEEPPSEEAGGVETGSGDKVASPRRSRTNESSGPQSPQKKEPSKFSLKITKELLTQNVMKSPPDKPKLGAPPIHKKPKPIPVTPVSAGTGSDPAESKNGLAGTEQQGGSAEEGGNVKVSPMNKGKKLPPGAFNMMVMGGVPVMKPGHSPERSRTGTVSTIMPREVREVSHEQVLDGEGRKESSDENEREIRSQLKAKLMKKMSKDEESGSDAGSTNASPQVLPKFKKRSGSTANVVDNADGMDAVDCDVVLTWTPDVTAAWLGQIELASYQQLFLEKGIQGYMLFDMDGHKLKGMGMVSDDRNIFKKEVKNLKPFADKQKKLMEKLRKEEKKQAKKKKK